MSMSLAMELSLVAGGGAGLNLTQQTLALNPVVMLDVSQLATMWQDRGGAAATTPAVVDSPVGTMKNLGTIGGYFLAPSDAARPTLRSAAGLYWLQFNGTNQIMSLTFAVTQPFVRISAVDPDNANSKQAFGGVTANAGALYMTAINHPGVYSGNALSGPADISTGVYVFEERHNNLSSRVRINAGSYASGTAGATLPGGMSIGGSVSASAYSALLFHAVSMYLSDIDAASIDIATRWAASKGGVTL